MGFNDPVLVGRNKQLTSAGGGFPGEVVEAWFALLLMVRRGGGNGLPSRENSDVQLLEVSKPARKLSHMINTWFGVANLDGGSKCISNGHLKDALDAQESLKLQSRTTIPHQREFMEGAHIGHESKKPHRYAVNSYSSRLPEEKLCSSLSWRSCGEEMKKVIRESLHGQNLLQISSDDEKTSSSRSLGVYFRSALGSSYHETEGGRKNSTAASEQPMKMKAPSLIARLMGLEEVPAEAAETTRKEQIRENLNAPRPMFHVGMPGAGRLLVSKQSPKPERVTLHSIIEREKIERLAKRGQEIGCRNQSDSNDTSADERYGKRFHMDEEDPSAVKAMQLPERGEQHELLASRPPSSHESIQATKVEHDEVIADRRRELAHESVRKEAVSSKKSKVESSKKSKMPDSVCDGQQKKEAKLHKRSFQGQKSLLDRTTPQSRNGLKAAAAPLSQAKKAAAASTEPNKRPASAKSIAMKAGATQQKSMMKPQREMVSGNSTNAAAEKRTAAAKPARKMTKLKTPKQRDGQEMSPSCKTDDGASAINISPAAEPSKQQKLSPKSSNNEKTGKDQKVIREVMPKSSKVGMVSGKAEAAAAKHVGNELISTTKRADKVEHLEALLLGCQSFLLHAYELTLNAHTPTNHGKLDWDEVDKDAKLYLGCAEELIERKRQHAELSGRHPMSLIHRWSRTEHASLDQIVGEISKGIGRLAKYSEADDDVISRDSLYVRLERDLRCKDVLINAMWDVGWRNGICMEEAYHVVSKVEEHIVSALVEKVAMELVDAVFVGDCSPN
ncbi:hypothetical protein MUK42_27858 [Musa troglodytarum]|uniref:DUF3741 domain-containing protein n=2 Tax=Musa troglodytarum TaxID=320322 RepID=A0A9E7F2D1_9LILI|nr:hypothetical protein MUK42_27858 [Musa troglodytarum]URD87294.1 hypothetical protein MUK42_27858 [Musa troglodytarum]